ncbi:multidrug transporter [Streptomyces agglomeratus]|uniref:Multidrug transporter n=1 Tax=Streptomyces agglomeratus TaxID=285458 RepID=A0A1E5PFL1_9ACTN|nr:phosphodiester glycosidase family protein [Streptomyces agglomeratus]OEJ28296.1 multidrug transporter [Streptomyces agglomeratus]OEJ57507.1 multidrug transporter [Streptomyces agglomeratus]
MGLGTVGSLGRAVALLATATALTAGAVSPADAGTTPDPRPRNAAEVLRPVAPPPASAPAGSTRSVVDGDGIETARSARPVAPGVRLTSYDRLESDKWLRVDALSVDLGGSGVQADYLHSGKVSDRRTVTELAAAHDPGEGRRTVAALNADFFDINQTGAPLGPGVKDGRPVHSPAPGLHRSVGIGPGSAGRVLQLYFEGTLTLPTGTRPLAAYNAANVPAGGVGAYNSGWGTADRALTVDAATPVAEAAVRDGKVVEVRDRPGTGPIPEGTTVLVGREAGAAALTALAPGDPVTMEYRARSDSGPVPRTSVGGRELLVVDGVPQNHDGQGNNTAAPRTAVGFSRDGGEMQVMTVDGRQADSGGVTLTELARMMKDAGAHSALNLDGGGSSTLIAREPGSDALQVENSPSDGSERTVPNGLALTAPDGSGQLRGFWVETRTPAGSAPTADPVVGGHPERVFPGLTRQLTAAGYDETYGPAEGRPRWQSSRASVGRVDGDGLFTAGRGGTTRVRAHRGPAEGGTRLTVLDDLARIEPTTRRVGLADAAAGGTFGIVGYDAHGTGAPVEPRDVRLDYDRSLFDIRDDGRGNFTVTSRTGTGAGQIKATVDGEVAWLAVSVGLAEQAVSAFDDAASWTFSQARASGSVAATPEGHTGTGLKLTYDFTQSTATRAAYASPPQPPLTVAGQPQSFTMWIKGDARGAWPTLHLKDAAGSDQLLRGPFVTWTGWRQVTFAVPPGAAMPLRVHRFYLAETAAAKQYTGEIVLDTLTAQVPPTVVLPERPAPADPLIDPAAETEGRDWRFAVMSDAQFVARDPDSAIVAQARRTLREIRAAKPDFLVVNGDLVDEGSPADLAFARRVLTEELGNALPWYYVPGNHEVMGGKIDNFIAEFGPAHRTFDHEGTRFITLDTSSLSLRGGGFAQIRNLRAQLDAASGDDSVGSVVLIQHVPPRDPTGQKGSQLGDRKEAALIERWLADFRRTTGKGAGLIGSHVGVFHAAHVDGVPYLVNGNSGKTPAGPADEGGFTGWSLVGVDKVSPREQATARHRPWEGGPDWVSVQTRAHVDALVLDAPTALPPGRAAPVKATVTQGARRVPAAFPLSADWTGSPNLHIGSAKEARPRHAAAFDPATGTLTTLRPGTITLVVTVNGTTQRTEVRVGEERAGSVTTTAATAWPHAAGG